MVPFGFPKKGDFYAEKSLTDLIKICESTGTTELRRVECLGEPET